MPPKRERKKTPLASKKSLVNASENVSEKSTIAKEAEKLIEFLHSNQKKEGYWEATPTLAGFLKLPLHRFDIGHEESNLVWCTVLVLIYCMTAVIDYHEYWKLLAEKAREWLFNQRFFTTATLQLVKRACTLFTDVDYKGMLSTIFAKAGDGTIDTDIEPIKRGNWVQMVLETPPYTKYYLNEVTKETRWEHPMDPHEPTFEERKAAEIKASMEKAKNDKLAIILPKRISINRSQYIPPRLQECESCAKGISAVVLCVVCDEYECQDCCDVIHMNPKKKDHLQSFRFISCYGRHGFPYLRPSLKALQEKLVGSLLLFKMASTATTPTATLQPMYVFEKKAQPSPTTRCYKWTLCILPFLIVLFIALLIATIVYAAVYSRGGVATTTVVTALPTQTIISPLIRSYPLLRQHSPGV